MCLVTASVVPVDHSFSLCRAGHSDIFCSRRKLITVEKSKKKSRSRSKENEQIWKKLKGLQKLIES